MYKSDGEGSTYHLTNQTTEIHMDTKTQPTPIFRNKQFKRLSESTELKRDLIEAVEQIQELQDRIAKLETALVANFAEVRS